MKNIDLDEFESIYDIKLPPHNQIVIRLDGVNFKKLTKNFTKPFDSVFSSIMETTMAEVAKKITGCYYAYTASDEVNFILDTNKDNTLYQNGRVQKIDSIVASMFSIEFYKNFVTFLLQYQETVENNDETKDNSVIAERIQTFWNFVNSQPVFDARCFAIPNEDIENYLAYRQNDCITNGINAMASMHFKHNEIIKLNTKQLRGKLFDVGDPWESMPEEFKFGIGYLKDRDSENKTVWARSTWMSEKALSLNKKTALRKGNGTKNES